MTASSADASSTSPTSRPSVRIAPSVLAADFAKLAEQLRAAEAAGADAIHIDIMDGRFVPNISFGALVIEVCKRHCQLPLDVHLMIVEPERYVADVIAAGADIVSLHAEACLHLHRNLENIRNLGAKAGLAVNPLTPLEVYHEALPMLDVALLMGVNPGFGGQRFIASSLQRLATLRQWIDAQGGGCVLELDGGVNADTAAAIVEAGADVLIAGSAVFGKPSEATQDTSETYIADNLRRLRQAVQQAESRD